MKTKLYHLLLLALITTGLHAAPRTPITAIVNGGNWSNASTWDLSRVPQNSDSVIIPAGSTIIFNHSYSLNDIYIAIAGTLNFNQNNTLALDAASIVNILNGGTLTATHPTPNELLTINGVTKYDGKTDVTLSGPIAATAMTGASPAGFSMVTLPVVFGSFAAIRNNGAIELNWNTGNESNNSHFDVERSTNGTDWETIGNIAAGENSTADHYSYTDEAAPAAQTQYRIRQVDLDGNFLYSKIVVVSATTTEIAQATIFATGKTVSIVPENRAGSRLIVRVFTIGGQVIQQQSFASTGSRIDLNVSAVTTGIYVVQVTDGGQWSVATKVML
ncbi:MAG TPA: G8 domain-containing protein [Puia sp.]|nr:G8 domain-containing protein [Puia sp.]